MNNNLFNLDTELLPKIKQQDKHITQKLIFCEYLVKS